MKKVLAFCSIILFLVMILSAMSILIVSAEETNELDYSKIVFWTMRTDSLRETPSDEKELEEMYAYITSDHPTYCLGICIEIHKYGQDQQTEGFRIPCEELSLSYLKQLASDPSIEWFVVYNPYFAVPVGDSGADAVIILCTAVAALTVFVILRKNRMPF